MRGRTSDLPPLLQRHRCIADLRRLESLDDILWDIDQALG
jgi:hypothetical protein